MSDIYQRALDKWGIQSQVDLALEEMAELIVALNHLKRGRGTVAQVHEELADVQIMIKQLSVFFGEIEVDAVKEKKLERLEQYLNS